MTTSTTKWSILTDGRDFTPTPADKAYFRAAFQHRVHEVVLETFKELAQSKGLDRSTLARRLTVDKAQITGWLALPGNWRLDTVSDLLLAMHSTPTLSAHKIGAQPTTIGAHADRTHHRDGVQAGLKNAAAIPVGDAVPSSSSRKPTFVPAPPPLP